MACGAARGVGRSQRVRWFVLPLTCLACAAGVGDAPPGDVATARQAVVLTLGELAAAWKQGDLPAIVERLDEEVAVLPPGGEWRQGRDLVGGWAAARAGRTTWPGPGADVAIEVHADMAFARCEPVPRDAGDTAGEHCLAVHRRGGDGRWRLLRLIWNEPLAAGDEAVP